jgi:putative addiction module component (TIGR02574 family)
MIEVKNAPSRVFQERLTMSFAELKNQALRLTPANRLKLSRILTRSLKEPDACELEVPLALLRKRAADLKSGRVKGVPLEAVFPELKGKLPRR